MSRFQDNLSQCLFVLMMLLAITSVNDQAQQSARRDDPQSNDKQTNAEIANILSQQATCWNNEDINGFMETYWKSENLTFSGGGKTTRGWQATLQRYQKKYPKGSMGSLKFSDLEISMLGGESSLVLGNWFLEIPSKDGSVKVQGNFSLVLRKIAGQWKIIHDHSSTLETEKESGKEHQAGQGTEKK